MSNTALIVGAESGLSASLARLLTKVRQPRNAWTWEIELHR